MRAVTDASGPPAESADLVGMHDDLYRNATTPEQRVRIW
jgi:hypothetical protein